MINYQIATKKELDDLFTVHHMVTQMHEEMMPEIFEPIEEKDEKKYLTTILKNKNNRTILAYDKEKVIGFMVVGVKERHRTYRNTYVAEVQSIGVLPKYQKKEIGQQLMEFAKQFALEKGLPELELNVYIKNDSAMKFYKKMGLKPLLQKMTYSLI